MLNLLIIDDEYDTASSKGYDSIDDWFPDVFRVDKARSFSLKSDEQSCISFLVQRKYDIILLDYNINFDSGYEYGNHTTHKLRYIFPSGKDSLSQKIAESSDAYILGVSEMWVRFCGRIPSYKDLNSYIAGEKPEQLHGALEDYLRTKHSDLLKR